ncbi:unnamed protein product [Effrenium voratum]|uniref:Prolyl 4-hydroxylase alpha subunit domain-containing protein n=1 Tax=Effrenium voratum TaxID=2562239 RepID=A0AA36IR06_9DINO|nr:unnamed protein product [Effrenium voratum]
MESKWLAQCPHLRTPQNCGFPTFWTEAVKFYPEEQAVLSASHDMLRLHPCDAISSTSDTMDVDWKGLQDMRLCYPDEKLLAVTAEGSQLGIWVVESFWKADLRREKVVGRPRGNAGRVSPTQAPPGPIDAEEATSSYAEVAAEVKAAAAAAMERVHHFREGGDAMPEPPRRPVERRPDRPVERPLENPARAPMERAPMERAPMERAERTERPERPDSPGPPQVEAKSPQSSYNGLRAPVAPVAPMEPPVASPPVSRPETRLDMDTIATQHPQMLGVLKRRLEQTRRLTELWAQGNFSSIGSVLTMPQDQAVLCDLARGLMRKDLGSALTLDACWAFLPLLKELLLTSKYEDFIATALEFTELLLGQFGNLISETRESCARIPERQLDLAREQRMRKCSSCYEHFKEIHQLLVAGPSARFGKLNSSLQDNTLSMAHEGHVCSMGYVPMRMGAGMRPGVPQLTPASGYQLVRLTWLGSSLGSAKLVTALKLVTMTTSPQPVWKLFGEDCIIDASRPSADWTRMEVGQTIFQISKDPPMQVVPDFLSPKEVDELLALVRDRWQPSMIDPYGTGEVQRSVLDRSSYQCDLRFQETPLVAQVEGRLAGLAQLPVECLEPLALVRYAPGQFFDLHHDGPDRPKTIFVYLNDVEEGETYFPLLGLKFTPRRGTAVMWCNSADGQVDDRILQDLESGGRWKPYGLESVGFFFFFLGFAVQSLIYFPLLMIVLDSFPANKCGFWQTNERHVSSGAACLERHEVRDELLLQLPGAT